MKLSRRKFFKKIWYGALTAGTCSAIDAFAIEPHITIVREIPLAVANLPREFAGKTIAHISDLHCGRCCSQDFLLRTMKKINLLNPDITILTGDYTSKYDKDDYFHLIGELVRELKAPLGVFACLGNHDYGLSLSTQRNIRSATSEQLLQNGVQLLRNSSQTISIGGQSIHLIGLGEAIRGDLNLKTAFDGLDTSTPRIVMAHNPDSLRRMRDLQFDAFLCGHTHGGQVCIPFYGAIVVPIRDKRFKKGQYSYEGKFVYVNSGLASLPTFAPGPRFLCPPEITLYRLTRKDATAYEQT